MTCGKCLNVVRSQAKRTASHCLNSLNSCVTTTGPIHIGNPMMSTNHPITPPPELIKQWWKEAQKSNDPDIACWLNYVATQAARWGADQELEACAKEVSYWSSRNLADRLRDCRRPKPSSLKEQALTWCNDYIDPDGVIRRALEALPDE